MNKKNAQLKKVTLKAMENYWEMLNDELDKTQKELSEKLERFCQTGVDEKKQYYLEDVEVENPLQMKKLNRENVMEFKENVIDDLNVKFLCKCLEKEYWWDWHCYCDEIEYCIDEICYIKSLVNQRTAIFDAIRALTHNLN